MSLSFDPQALPVTAVDSHLCAVPATRLSATALRQRFQSPPPWTAEHISERRLLARTPTRASVLVTLILREEITVLLTQRTEHLTDHPGQISFPGGRAEPQDQDALATALREAREEVGLEPEYVEVLGTLPVYNTGTGFSVTPVIALARSGFVLKADPGEVAEVFEVPLSFLMDPAHHRHHEVELDGVHREFLSMPWDGVDALGQPRRYFIWGATAAMLRNFYRLLIA